LPIRYRHAMQADHHAAFSAGRELLARALLPAAVAVAVAAGCDDSNAPAAAAEGASAGATAAARPSGGSGSVDSISAAVSSAAPATRSQLGIRGYAVNVYDKPRASSSRLGYLRVGAVVDRSAEAIATRGCKGGWYAVKPRGHVCAGHEATTDLSDPLLRASTKRPDLSRPLPYRYGFVRAVLPLYLRIPSAAQQYKSEFKLEEHLDWYKDHKDEVQSADLGADDVPIDARGVALSGKKLGELGRRKNSAELNLGELFGGSSAQDPPPFWLRNGRRLIPNISGFDVPEYAVFADRARRHTGLAFIGSFRTEVESLRRRFAVTTDLRLAPTTKVKPDSASAWHGVEVGNGLKLPFAFTRRRGAQLYDVAGASATSVGDARYRSVHQLSGKLTKVDGERYVQRADGRWLRAKQAGLVVPPRKWPKPAKKGEKWIEVDISEQVLVLWEGKRAVYATLVSTGRPAMGDCDEVPCTPRGIFRIYSKHISATMDSDAGFARKKVAEKGLKPGDDGYVPDKGDGLYGITKRRGEGLYKLRDVPHIQYFDANYAIHGAYWHDVFGIPRSHGCINLAPVDSLRVFLWTEPAIPDGWHGVRTDRGTTVIVHK